MIVVMVIVVMVCLLLLAGSQLRGETESTGSV